MSNHAQEFANAKRNKMKSVNKAVGLVTRGPGIGTSANKPAPQPEPKQKKKEVPNPYTDSYKLQVADTLKPTNGDGTDRRTPYKLLKDRVNNQRVIGNAFKQRN